MRARDPRGRRLTEGGSGGTQEAWQRSRATRRHGLTGTWARWHGLARPACVLSAAQRTQSARSWRDTREIMARSREIMGWLTRASRAQSGGDDELRRIRRRNEPSVIGGGRVLEHMQVNPLELGAVAERTGRRGHGWHWPCTCAHRAGGAVCTGPARWGERRSI